MLDFTELSKNGEDFELLVREILFCQGFQVYWSGRGPDGGRDLICIEKRTSYFMEDERKWLIQCKHNAHGGASVGINDLDNVVDSCFHHKAQGYILACSTIPSSAVVNRLEGITADPRNDLSTTFWDATAIERKLSTPRMWRIAQRFFPTSARAREFDIYATDKPNQWVVNYRGYYFHLINRIGSHNSHHFESIDQRIDDMESIKLPDAHCLRLRSCYYDDKCANYYWYIDYMHPFNQSPVVNSEILKEIFGDGHVLEDGQIHDFDIRVVAYLPHSDHHDFDHYDYYLPFTAAYLLGAKRELSLEETIEQGHAQQSVKENGELQRTYIFNQLTELVSSIEFIRVIRSSNAQIEKLNKFSAVKSTGTVFKDENIETDMFFTAWFRFEVTNLEAFRELMLYIPQGIDGRFQLSRYDMYVPQCDGPGCERRNDEDLFDLNLTITPDNIATARIGRTQLNKYFLEVIHGINSYLKQVKHSED